MSKIFLIRNIDWDTDGEPVDDLPNEVAISHSTACDLCGLPETAADEEILEELEENYADILSDHYGFCVFSAEVGAKDVEN